MLGKADRIDDKRIDVTSNDGASTATLARATACIALVLSTLYADANVPEIYANNILLTHFATEIYHFNINLKRFNFKVEK